MRSDEEQLAWEIFDKGYQEYKKQNNWEALRLFYQANKIKEMDCICSYICLTLKRLKNYTKCITWARWGIRKFGKDCPPSIKESLRIAEKKLAKLEGKE